MQRLCGLVRMVNELDSSFQTTVLYVIMWKFPIFIVELNILGKNWISIASVGFMTIGYPTFSMVDHHIVRQIKLPYIKYIISIFIVLSTANVSIQITNIDLIISPKIVGFIYIPP